MSLLLISKAYSTNDDGEKTVNATSSNLLNNGDRGTSFSHAHLKTGSSTLTSTSLKLDNSKVKNVHKMGQEAYLETASFKSTDSSKPSTEKEFLNMLNAKKQQGIFKCLMCSKVFPTPLKLEDHVRTHTGESPYNCPVCSNTFKSLDNLKRHKVAHTEQRPFTCLTCGKIFKLNHNLNSHAAKVHSAHGSFKVAKNFSPASKSNGRRIHKGDASLHCLFCKKSFSEPTYMKTHQLTHTGERPFLCQTCGKGFLNATKLRRHVRVHTGERPYQCQICSKGFTDSSNLKAHQRVHSK